MVATALSFKELFDAAKTIEPNVISWRHHLHQYPELSNREVKTAEYIAQRLRDFGFRNDEICEQVGGTGVLARLTGKHSAKAVLLRADIDALPVKEETDLPYKSNQVQDYPGGPFPVAHACGHDCHMSMLLGAAQVLASRREQIPGTVYFAFQPAEEGAPGDEEGGAAFMLRSPEFQHLSPRPSLAFGIHVIPAPTGMVGWTPEVQNAASEMLKITVTGEQVHGSSPWAGRDPLPPAADIISAMGQLYRQFDAKDAFTISIGHVEDQGRFNIVGEQVTLFGTVRCLNAELIDDINTAIVRTCRNIAAAYNCAGEVEFHQQVPAVVNSPETIAALQPALIAAAGGEDRVFTAPASLGYDDVSEFINVYGGMYALLGVQDVEPVLNGLPRATAGGRGFVPNHSPRFYANDAALLTGVRMHLAVVAQHLALA
ncbi:MAG: amidohydrolase [Arcanobacterium sp.]|nr:amidohydrolase [Arcanobacterium sp.]